VWKQADLARHAGIASEAVKRRLEEMQAAGFPFEREVEHPHVYWSLPKNWIPGGVAVTGEDVLGLVRILLRTPESPVRDRLLERLLPNIPDAVRDAAADAVDAPSLTAREQKFLAIVEDAARTKATLRFDYYTASSGRDGARHASVHRVRVGPPARFVATCHRSGALKWFRVENVRDARLLDASVASAGGEAYRPARESDVDAFIDESLDGFHANTDPEELSFFVRSPEANWVARNLLPGMKLEDTVGGIRVSAKTTARIVVARYVVGLGEAATPETPELAAAVADLARGALAQAVSVADTSAAPEDADDASDDSQV